MMCIVYRRNVRSFAQKPPLTYRNTGLEDLIKNSVVFFTLGVLIVAIAVTVLIEALQDITVVVRVRSPIVHIVNPVHIIVFLKLFQL